MNEYEWNNVDSKVQQKKWINVMCYINQTAGRCGEERETYEIGITLTNRIYCECLSGSQPKKKM